MSEKKKDILEKGAVIQADYQTYAIVPHLPGGLCTPAILRNVADVAEKYKAAAIKLTGASRLAMVGLREEDLDNVWADLTLSPGAAVGLCVRSIKFCPGITFCRLGKQDAVGLGMKIDEKYHGVKTPSKLKIGISGCPNCCAESWLKDIGFIGTAKGWKIVVGGNAASKPMIAQVLAKDLSDDDALVLVEKVIEGYKKHTKPQRLGKLISEIGLEEFKKEAGISC
ncbi:MAG: NAD(P)/FAD-dependent oxidoreductase [Deltaproteobacteria bacterium]|nr:NAD(P)/FAD-dependent oxidoreductase [Deltaproteobacteria bacterium]